MRKRAASIHCTPKTIVNIDLLRSTFTVLRLELAFYAAIQKYSSIRKYVYCVRAIHPFFHPFSFRWQITVVWHVNEWNTKKMYENVHWCDRPRKQSNNKAFIHINCALNEVLLQAYFYACLIFRRTEICVTFSKAQFQRKKMETEHCCIEQ